MGFFADLDRRMTENIYAHGNYFTDPEADHDERLDEAIDFLMSFVRPEARGLVKAQVLGLIREYGHPRLRLRQPAGPRD